MHLLYIIWLCERIQQRVNSQIALANKKRSSQPQMAREMVIVEVRQYQ